MTGVNGFMGKTRMAFAARHLIRNEKNGILHTLRFYRNMNLLVNRINSVSIKNKKVRNVETD